MLKKLFVIALIAAIVQVQAFAQTGQDSLPEKPNEAEVVKPDKAKIAAGTTLEFGLISPLSSATAKAGDDVPLRLLRPLVAGNTTLLAEGTIVHGRVKTARAAGPKKLCGTLLWSIDRLSFPDGSSVKVETGTTTTDDTRAVPYKTALQWDPNWLEATGFLVALAPLALAGAVLWVIFAGPAYLLGIYPEWDALGTPCTPTGIDINLPEGTRVAVVVKKNHTVRF